MAQIRLTPDTRGCEIHGLEHMSSYFSKELEIRRWVCLACQRERSKHKNRWGSPRCWKRGHLKTPWTWKMLGGHMRCLPCMYEGRRRRIADRDRVRVGPDRSRRTEVAPRSELRHPGLLIAPGVLSDG